MNPEAKHVGGNNLFRFGSQEEAEAFAKHQWPDGKSEVTWASAGWYVQDIHEKSHTCGCCSTETYRLRPVADLRYDIEQEIKSIQARLRAEEEDLRELLPFEEVPS